MRRSPLLLLLALSLALAACDSDRDYLTRMAVKGLATAPLNRVRSQMAKVVARGSYALPDIEQEYPGADPAGRLRLLEALQRIGAPQALPFVRHAARWDDDEKVRAEAERVVKAIQSDGKGK